MAFWVYILQSEVSGLHYCGQTTDLERRLRQHNDPEYRLSKTTKRLEGPWKLIWSKACGDRSEATRLERKIKKRGIERFVIGEDRQSPADGGINPAIGGTAGSSPTR